MTDAATESPRTSCESFLDRALRRLEVSQEMAQLLRVPFREIQFELPLRRDDGSLALFKGFRVQHDHSRGPFKGGVRYHPDGDLDHFVALASTMSWKTAVAGLPFGGAKGGIDCDPETLSVQELEQLTKRFVERIDMLIGPDADILAPDMGTDEREMAWAVEAYSKRHGFEPAVATGKPLELGGSKGRREATGRGVALAAGWAVERSGQGLDGASVAIQGFGKVGSQAARFLAEAGARVVAVSDAGGGLHRAGGLDVPALLEAKAENPSARLGDLGTQGEEIDNGELLALEVDLLVPAAVGGVIHEGNVDKVRAGRIVEGANLPLTCGADAALRERGVEILPDILANAGGVIVSYLEWVQNRQRYQWPEERVGNELERILRRAWEGVVERAEAEGCDLRLAAYLIALERIQRAIELRGL